MSIGLSTEKNMAIFTSIAISHIFLCCCQWHNAQTWRNLDLLSETRLQTSDIPTGDRRVIFVRFTKPQVGSTTTWNNYKTNSPRAKDEIKCKTLCCTWFACICLIILIFKKKKKIWVWGHITWMNVSQPTNDLHCVLINLWHKFIFHFCFYNDVANMVCFSRYEWTLRLKL